MKKIGLALLITLGITGCSSTVNNQVEIKTNDNSANVVESKVDILNNGKPVSLAFFKDIPFVLDSVDGYKTPEYNNVNLVFTSTEQLGNIVRGDTGCNRYFAKYETVRSLLITSEIVATQNKCSGDLMQIEDFMFKIYSQRPVVSFNNDLMTFSTPTNKLIFRKQ